MPFIGRCYIGPTVYLGVTMAAKILFPLGASVLRGNYRLRMRYFGIVKDGFVGNYPVIAPPELFPLTPSRSIYFISWHTEYVLILCYW
jgi:hypothetical protein